MIPRRTRAPAPIFTVGDNGKSRRHPTLSASLDHVDLGITGGQKMSRGDGGAAPLLAENADGAILRQRGGTGERLGGKGIERDIPGSYGVTTRKLGGRADIQKDGLRLRFKKGPRFGGGNNGGFGHCSDCLGFYDMKAVRSAVATKATPVARVTTEKLFFSATAPMVSPDP